MVLKVTQLYELLAELLELPYNNNETGKKPAQIVNAILETMKGAMRRGERIHVFGWGTMTVKTRGPHRVRNIIRGQGKNIEHSKTTSFQPAKKYVHFKADAGIQRGLLDETQPRKALMLLRAHTSKVL